MELNKEKTYDLDDTVIAHIARLLQVALLTGTDVIDHMRMIRLKENENNILLLEDNYKEVFDGSIDKMLDNAITNSEESSNE